MTSNRLRFLLDTNILIPLQDSYLVLNENLQNFIRLAGIGGHQLVYHPASLEDIKRDSNAERRNRTLSRLNQYQKLHGIPACPWNTGHESLNDICDNQILYALECNAAHALITEDKGIHAKARLRGLSSRVYNIQTAEDWLRRLHEPKEVKLPNIEDTPLYALSPELTGTFFDSLREDYQPFDSWFSKKAQEGRYAWVCRDESGQLGAVCIYAVQENEKITDEGHILAGKSLKLCTFKVGEGVRGRKIGELFLKAAFRYASENLCSFIFVHGNAEKQPYLVALLEEFGFCDIGNYDVDRVWVKKHPIAPPTDFLPAKEYMRRYFPHFRQDKGVAKYLVPIQPDYHDILFPDFVSQKSRQLQLFSSTQSHVGNAIKLAYLCHAQINHIEPGDILLFYRSRDEKCLTTIAVVDDFKILDDPTAIAAMVSRRTVYSFNQISKMSEKKVKVILFRLIKHLGISIPLEELKSRGILSGAPQSIVNLSESKYRSLANAAGI